MREEAKAEEEQRRRRSSKEMRASNRHKQLDELKIPDVVSPSNASRSSSNGKKFARMNTVKETKIQNKPSRELENGGAKSSRITNRDPEDD